jgi:hypothetical protein
MQRNKENPRIRSDDDIAKESANGEVPNYAPLQFAKQDGDGCSEGFRAATFAEVIFQGWPEAWLLFIKWLDQVAIPPSGTKSGSIFGDDPITQGTLQISKSPCEFGLAFPTA